LAIKKTIFLDGQTPILDGQKNQPNLSIKILFVLMFFGHQENYLSLRSYFLVMGFFDVFLLSKYVFLDFFFGDQQKPKLY